MADTEQQNQVSPFELRTIICDGETVQLTHREIHALACMGIRMRCMMRGENFDVNLTPEQHREAIRKFVADLRSGKEVLS